MLILRFWDDVVPCVGHYWGVFIQKGTVPAVVEHYNVSATGCSLDIFCSGETGSPLDIEITNDEGVFIAASEEGQEI